MMKLSKILLVLSSVFFFNTAFAEEFVLARGKLSGDDTPEYIKLAKCVQADEIKIVAKKDKIELKKALVTFQSGKDKNVLFPFTTLEPNEETSWRGLGWHSDDSCVDSILIHGYAKHAKQARIVIKGKRD